MSNKYRGQKTLIPKQDGRSIRDKMFDDLRKIALKKQKEKEKRDALRLQKLSEKLEDQNTP